MDNYLIGLVRFLDKAFAYGNPGFQLEWTVL